MIIFDKADGQPVAATNSAIWEAAPGDRRELNIYGSTDGGTWAQYLTNSTPTGAAVPMACEPVGARDCLQIDQWLRRAMWVLQGTSQGPTLLRRAAEFGVQIRRQRTPVGSLGSYSLTTKTVVVDTRLDAYSDWERAAVLAHELQHAVDHADGKLAASGAACLGNEEDAFRTQGQVWSQLWKNRLPAAAHAAQDELNAIVLTIGRDPLRFVQTLIGLYKHQCA